MIRVLLYILLLLMFTKRNYAQEPVFSQFNFNPIYLNPALAGIDNNFRLFFNKRNQWGKIPSQFNTNSISIDSWQNNTNSAISMMYSNGTEGEGLFRTGNFFFGGAYRLFDVFPSPFAWQFGFQYQNINKSIDWSRLVFSDELDHYLGDIGTSSFINPNTNSYNVSNVALGTVMSYHIKRGSRYRRFHIPVDFDLELGLAVHNFIPRPNSFLSNQFNNSRKYTLHGSVLWPFKSKKLYGAIKHSAVYINQGALSTLQIGLAESWIYPFHLGMFYRQQMTSLAVDLDKFESFYFIIGYQKVVKESNLSFTFSYSRDFTISELGSYTNGTNELSIIIESIEGGLFANMLHAKRHSKNKYRSIPCYSKFNTRAGLL
tara:strand:- start:593 stop:1711 length:1119 start_codon:yes stop_codon:yes gene_type:complete